MSAAEQESTQVVIVGAGPAGLTLANLLQRSGVACVVLEVRDRGYVEKRQRAGVLDHYAGRIFEEYGLADRGARPRPAGQHVGDPVRGRPRFLNVPELAGDRPSRLVPQQLLVQRLIATFTDGGGDLRFEALDVTPHDLDGPRPRVTYRDPDGGEHELACSYVAGCDGFHGVSRRSIPAGALTAYTFDHGIGWYTVLADAPAPRYPLMGDQPARIRRAIRRVGRGPAGSTCSTGRTRTRAPGGRPAPGPQLRLRLGDPGLPAGPITDREIVEMRSFVADPWRTGRCFWSATRRTSSPRWAPRA